jgi:hypothetical protein
MRLVPLIALINLLITPLILGGCGSSYADDELSAIAKMQSAIATYNQATQTDLQTTASACSRASTDLKSQRNQLDSVSPPDRYKHLAAALRQAYALAERGFINCVSAARTLNYPLMARADHQIAQANASILQVRALDRQL